MDYPNYKFSSEEISSEDIKIEKYSELTSLFLGYLSITMPQNVSKIFYIGNLEVCFGVCFG